MIQTRRLDLPRLVPPEAAGCDQCMARLEDSLRATEGVSEIHLNRARGVAILHFDPDVVSLAALEDRAQHEGARLGATYVHRVLPIEGMDCADCARTLERGVGRLDGVRWVAVNFAGARMAVEYASDETTMDSIAARVSDLGYRVSDATPGQPHEESGLRSLLAERGTRLLVVGAALTLLGGALQLSGAPRLLTTFSYAATALVAGLPIARKGLAGLRATRSLDINALMTIAVIGAALLGQWLEAATVVVLFSLGEALEGYTVDRARRSIRSLLSLTPAEATVRTAAGELRVPVGEIVPGDTIVVRPGERIPTDGLILSGQSAVNQAPITGESLPVEKAPGDELFAGTVNGQGVLEVRATRPASDSTLARIIRLVEDAQAQKAPTQRFVDVFARYYTPAVVAGAALVALVPPLAFGADWGSWLYRALVLLVIACPCALVISTPVAIVSALSSAARSGVLIKGGSYLEALSSLRALAFDKTGTLTYGAPEVTIVVALDGAAQDEVLRLAAAAERYSEHPLGKAIVAATERRGLLLLPNGSAATVATAGHGIEAVVDGARVRVGTRGFVADGATDEAVDRQLRDLEAAGQTAVLVSRDGQVIGAIGLTDQLRPEAADAVHALKRAGVAETVMLTGDRREVAEAIAAHAGVDQVEPELLPGQKVAAIERLLGRYGRVGMVGDGVNDAPALARATVGIAMGAAGTDTALETADVALMGDDLGKIAGVMRLSRAARRTIAQNIALALAIKAVFLVLAVGGEATLWEAVFADVGASLIVIANGMRLLRRQLD